MKDFDSIRKQCIDFLCSEKQKEWACHVRFVEKIALSLVEEYGGDRQVVSIAAILHDIGRDKELPGEDHRDTGKRIATNFLSRFAIESNQKELILKCIHNHGADTKPKTIEEKIIISADSASKVIYHQAFMLMVKKDNYIERARWGMKYLDKGLQKIQFTDYKKQAKAFYDQYVQIYNEVLR